MMPDVVLVGIATVPRQTITTVMASRMPGIVMPLTVPRAVGVAKARHVMAATGTDAAEVATQTGLDAAAIRNRVAAHREYVVAAGLLPRLLRIRLRLRR